ncbi:MAG: hypothetical protein Q4A41_06810, partial [Bacillota bacterium]|nr:hypothetical protein [Bacillota bacterium]
SSGMDAASALPSEKDPAKRLVLPAVIASNRWAHYQDEVNRADCVEISHLSHLAFHGLSDKIVTGSYMLNILNAKALDFYLRHGVRKTEISSEIGEDLLKGGNSIIPISREHITLMRMAYCPVGAHFGGGQKCGLCEKYDFAVRDEKGVEFPLYLDRSTCMAQILSPGNKVKGKKIKDL